MFIRPTSFQPLSSDNISYSGVMFVPAADGSVDVALTSEPPAPLPSYDTLQIDNLLSAGVPLEKVNPHILGHSSMSEHAAAKKIYDIVESHSSNSAPVDSAPVDSSPVDSAPVDSAPVDHL